MAEDCPTFYLHEMGAMTEHAATIHLLKTYDRVAVYYPRPVSLPWRTGPWSTKQAKGKTDKEKSGCCLIVYPVGQPFLPGLEPRLH